jgi:TP901 family phage tail tape measure protein
MAILPPVVARLFADARQYEATMAKSDATMAKFGDTALTAGEKMNRAMNRATNYVVAAGAIIGVTSVKMAADFQSATTRIVTDAGESVKNLDLIRKGILGMAQQVGQTPKQLADGLYYIESAGYHGADALKILKASAEGASVGFTDMANMGSAVTTVMRDYNLPASRAAAVTSALIETVAQGKTNMTLLGNSMGRVLPIAASFGIPFEQVAGAIATMTVSGQQARFGVQQIRNSFMNLAAPGNHASKVMAQIGITSDMLHKALMDPKKGVSNALTLVTEQLGKYFPRGSAQYIAAQRTIYGGITGLSVALALGGEHLKKYNETVRLIGEAYDSANPGVKNFAEVSKTLNFQLKQLTAGAGVIGIEIGNYLLPSAVVVAHWAENIISFFKRHPLISTIASASAISAFVGAVVFKLGAAMSKLFSTVKALFSGANITSNTTATVANTAALEANTVAQGGAAAETAALGTSIAAGSLVAPIAIAAAATAAMMFMASHGPKYGTLSNTPTKQQLQWRTSMPMSLSPFAGGNWSAPNARLVINNKATVRSNSGKW